FYDDQVERLPPEGGVVGRRPAAHLLGVEPRIDQDVEVTELDEQRVGAYAAVAVQVNELHSSAPLWGGEMKQFKRGRAKSPEIVMAGGRRGRTASGARAPWRRSRRPRGSSRGP